MQVRVSDGLLTDTEQVVVSPGNSPPTITAMSPAASLTWAVGETISFSATATDPQQSLADSAFSWSLTIEHCPSVCHSHPLTTWSGQRTGSFPAPDHEYPSDLLLQVTVTDSQGLTDTETVQLDPKSVPMTFASNPTGAALTVAGAGVFAPHNQTFIQGSNFNVSAPPTRVVGGANYNFTSWSDGGAATHAVVAPATATTLTASYTRQNRLPTVTVSANPTSGPAPLTVNFTTNASDPDGDNAGFTYEWALDGDGVFNDGGGATKQKQYTTAGSRTVQVRVTDSHGGQDTDQVTVNVGTTNQPPVAAITTTPTTPDRAGAVQRRLLGLRLDRPGQRPADLRLGPRQRRRLRRRLRCQCVADLRRRDATPSGCRPPTRSARPTSRTTTVTSTNHGTGCRDHHQSEPAGRTGAADRHVQRIRVHRRQRAHPFLRVGLGQRRRLRRRPGRQRVGELPGRRPRGATARDGLDRRDQRHPGHGDVREHPHRCSAPSPRRTARAGRSVSRFPFSATATDAQDGTLPATAFTWTLREGGVCERPQPGHDLDDGGREVRVVRRRPRSGFPRTSC